MSNDDARFDPSSTGSAPGGTWLTPGGAPPPPAWTPIPPGEQMWTGGEKGNWFARHRMLSGIGAGLLGLSLLAGVGAVAEQTIKTSSATQSAAAPPAPIIDLPPAEDEPAVAVEKVVADKTAAKKNASTKKTAADKAAADKAAARKRAAEKKAAAKRAAAERKAARQRATLPRGTDCDLLGDEAVRISRESKLKVKVTGIRELKIMKDNRTTFRFPTGASDELVLSCRGLATTSDGMTDVPVAVRLVVDASGDYYVVYRGL
jgi:hypothetical protein